MPLFRLKQIAQDGATTGQALVWNGTTWAPTALRGSKTITIEDPTASEDIGIHFTNVAITITEIRAVVRGSTPSVTWTIRHATTRDATGNEVVTSGTTTTSQVSGDDVTSFNDATIPLDSFIWIETTAQTGTVDELQVTLHWDED